MNSIIKNILKEEYNNTKLKGFVYNYFDKKIESGEWRWEGDDTITFLLDNKNYVLLKITKTVTINHTYIYEIIYEKFVDSFNIKQSKLEKIISSYIENKLGLNKVIAKPYSLPNIKLR